MKFNYEWIVWVVLFVCFVIIVNWVVSDDKITQSRIAKLPQMEYIGEIANSDHTTLNFYEFTPPKYPNKRCLFIKAAPHRSGLTCWDIPGD